MDVYFGLTRDWNAYGINLLFSKLNEFTYTKRFFENKNYGSSCNEIGFEINVLDTDCYDRKIEKKETLRFMSKRKCMNFQIYLDFEEFVKGNETSKTQQLTDGLYGCILILEKRKIEGFDIDTFKEDLFLYLVARKIINPSIISW
jgi:hypothetical protein